MDPARIDVKDQPKVAVTINRDSVSVNRSLKVKYQAAQYRAEVGRVGLEPTAKGL